MADRGFALGRWTAAGTQPLEHLELRKLLTCDRDGRRPAVDELLHAVKVDLHAALGWAAAKRHSNKRTSDGKHQKQV
jgi:hypothetical protein